MNNSKVFAGFLASALALTATAENLVFNGSFEEGKPGASYILPGWVRRTAGNSFDFHKIDKTNASEGSRSGCITVPADKPKGSGYLTTSKRFPLQSGKKYRLTLDAKSPQGKAVVYLIAYDSKNKAVSYSRYGKLNIANSAEWKKFELIYTAPTQDPAGYTGALQLTLQGSGQAWFDNIKVEPLDKASAAVQTAPAAAPAANQTGKNLIPNASFEEGRPGASQILPGWVRRTAGKSFGFHSVDSTQSADGKRSIRIAIPADAPDKSTGYVAANYIKVEKGKSYKLSFKARCPQGKASATVILYDSKKRYAGFGGVRKTEVKNSDTWQTFESEYFTPNRDADGYYICLQLELRGAGEVWFDDVKLAEFAPAAIKTEFYPSSLNYERKLIGIVGEQLPMIFYFFTTGKRTGFTLDLEMPAAMRPVFSGVVYAVNTPQVPAVPQKGAAPGYQRYRLTLPADAILPMGRFSADLFSGLSLLFDGDPGANGVLKWQISQAGKKLDGGVFSVSMLPPEQTAWALPEYPVIFSWYEPYLNYVRDAGVLQRYLNNMLKSGISGASISESKEKALFNRAKFTNQRGFWQQAPDNCLTGMLNNQKIWQRIDAMAKNLASWHNSILCWNFEPDLRDFYHYCDLCHRAFCKAARLPESTAIKDGYAAEKLYPEEYMRFRCSQHNAINERFNALCKKHHIRSGINGYRVNRGMDMLELKRRTGGVREIIERVDIYQAQIYALPDQLWLWQQDMLKYNANTMITYTTDERSKGGTFPYSLITPELIECEILIAGIQRVKNLVLFVGYHTLDGRQIIALRRALSRIAGREYMLDGKAEYITSQGSELIRWRKFTRDGKTLLAAVNCDGTRTLYSAVPLPDGTCAADPERRSIIQRNKQGDLAIRLKPYEVRFFEIHRQSSAPAYTQEAAAEAEKPRQARTLLNKADWNLFEDASGVISVKYRNRELWQIRRNDGAILSGKNYDGKTDFYFRDLFNVPREAAWSAECRLPYELVSSQITSQGLKIDFRQTLQHRLLKGLQLQKSYLITPKTVQAAVRIVNRSKQSVRIAFWQHHRPPFPVGKPLKVVSGAKSLVIDSHSPTNNYLAGGTNTLNINGNMTLQMSKVPTRYYFWHAAGHSISCEMFFPAVELQSGQSWEVNSELK